MKQDKTEILPLYHFFELLRQNGFPLGIGEYQLFLKALELCLGISLRGYRELLETLDSNGKLNENDNGFPKTQLLNLCKSLWLKPNQSIQAFEDIFEEAYLQDYQPKAKQEAKPVENPNTVIEKGKSKTPVPEPLPPEEPNPYVKNTKSLIQEQISKDQPISVRIAISEHQSENDIRLENKKAEIENTKFLFTQYYFPIDRRKIQQNLKKLPTYKQLNFSNEIDLTATINKAIEKGKFHEIVLKKNKVNASFLLLLIDHQGSMIAFEQLSKMIELEIVKILGGNKKKKDLTIATMYFCNCPADFLYKNQTHTKFEQTSRVLEQLKAKSANVIFISDAGAARGTFSPGRIQATKDFLARLIKCSNKMVWLNPMPKERWNKSSAARIADYVAMFETTESGIKNAVDFLKGSNTKTLKPI